MNKIIEQVQKELGVNSCSSRVLDKLASMSGMHVNYVGSPEMGPRAKKAPTANLYGVRRLSDSKGYRIIGTAKECAEYMAGEIE